eukprot:59537_1
MSRLLQELFLIICTRDNIFNDVLTVPDIIHIKRYDIVYAIYKYHGGYGKIQTVFPNPPKVTNYWNDIDNVAKEVRNIMQLYDQMVMPHANQLTYSGNGWLRECIIKHGGFDKFADFIHAETNFDENMEERDVDGYWENLENIYDELMTFIYDININFMPNKLELLSGGYEKLWNGLINVASVQYQTELIKLKTKQLKRKFKGKWKLLIENEENYTPEFQGVLDEQLFILKESKEFNKILSELEIMKYVSIAFKIPINKEFEGYCQFVKEARNEWKDFGSLAKELMAFHCFYSETCFTLNREFVDNFVLPKMEDIAYCMRPDLNYAILRWHGGYKRVENKIRVMKVIDLYHPMYGEGMSRDELLYLEHGSVWQFKALPPPPNTLSDGNLLIGEDIDTMFLPEAMATKDMIDPTLKITKDKKLYKKIQNKRVTLLLT